MSLWTPGGEVPIERNPSGGAEPSGGDQPPPGSRPAARGFAEGAL